MPEPTDEEKAITKAGSDSQGYVQKSAEQTSNYLMDKMKTVEMRDNNKKTDEIRDTEKKKEDEMRAAKKKKEDEMRAAENKKYESESGDKEIEAKGEDTDFSSTVEKVAYGLLIIGGIALGVLILCSVLSMIFFTPIPAAVFTAFGITAAIGLFTGGACYLSKFVVDVGQTFARTKFKGSSTSKSKEPVINKKAPKVSAPKIPPKQSQAKNKEPIQNNQHALKIRSDKEGTSQQI